MTNKKFIVNFDALGYIPFQTKPVHFANGFFLSLTGKSNRLEYLNKTAVIKTNRGLEGDYEHEALHEILVDDEKLDPSISVENLRKLRLQVNGIVDNDEAVFPKFTGHGDFGNEYTLISDRLITENNAKKDGYSGHFVHQVLETTSVGNEILKYASNWITRHDTPLENFLTPILDSESIESRLSEEYEEKLGTLTVGRLSDIASMMDPQTNAIAQLCHNLENDTSHHMQLRELTIALCSWLFVYIQKISDIDRKMPIMFMDFNGGENTRTRTLSRNCYSRQRDWFCKSYQTLREKGEISYDDSVFLPIEKNVTDPDIEKIPDYKFLEDHFHYLSLRIGFSQPRSNRVQQKHFELQPETARILMSSILASEEVLEFEPLSVRLREIWGPCYGGSHDDIILLNKHGYSGLDYDEDLIPNSARFSNLLKRLNLAVEPSDGLILCANNPEELL
nr:hypothetical protein [uncultured Methanoregula sp.]